jgi:hypothetical protein
MADKGWRDISLVIDKENVWWTPELAEGQSQPFLGVSTASRWLPSSSTRVAIEPFQDRAVLAGALFFAAFIAALLLIATIAHVLESGDRRGAQHALGGTSEIHPLTARACFVAIWRNVSGLS